MADRKPIEFPEAPLPPSLPITAERLNWLLDVIGWEGTYQLSNRLGVRADVAANWRKGKSFIPNRVAVWLETLASVHLALPLPAFWGDKAGVGAAKHPDQPEDVSQEFVEGGIKNWELSASEIRAGATPADPWGDE